MKTIAAAMVFKESLVEHAAYGRSKRSLSFYVVRSLIVLTEVALTKGISIPHYS